MRSQIVPVTVRLALVVVAAASLAACSEDDEELLYCGDADRVVVDPARCEEDGSTALIYRGAYPHGLVPGATLPPGGSAVAAGDANGRVAAGLPARGGFGGNAARVAG